MLDLFWMRFSARSWYVCVLVRSVSWFSVALLFMICFPQICCAQRVQNGWFSEVPDVFKTWQIKCGFDIRLSFTRLCSETVSGVLRTPSWASFWNPVASILDLRSDFFSTCFVILFARWLHCVWYGNCYMKQSRTGGKILPFTSTQSWNCEIYMFFIARDACIW